MIRILQLLIFGHIHHWEKDGNRMHMKRGATVTSDEFWQPCRCTKCGAIKTFEVLT